MVAVFPLDMSQPCPLLCCRVGAGWGRGGGGGGVEELGEGEDFRGGGGLIPALHSCPGSFPGGGTGCSPFLPAPIALLVCPVAVVIFDDP